MIYDPDHKDAAKTGRLKGYRRETEEEHTQAIKMMKQRDVERAKATSLAGAVRDAKKAVVEPIVRGMRSLEEEEHAEPVGAGIEDITDDDVLGSQPGLGFDLRSQAAFGELFARYNGGKDTAKMGDDFEKIAQIDPKLSDVFKALILSNPILFPDETPGSVDLLRNDPEAVDAALAGLEVEPGEPPKSSLKESVNKLLKENKKLRLRLKK